MNSKNFKYLSTVALIILFMGIFVASVRSSVPYLLSTGVLYIIIVCTIFENYKAYIKINCAPKKIAIAHAQEYQIWDYFNNLNVFKYICLRFVVTSAFGYRAYNAVLSDGTCCVIVSNAPFGINEGYIMDVYEEANKTNLIFYDF